MNGCISWMWLCVCMCDRKKEKRATECTDHVRSSERRGGTIISPSDVKECLPAVELALRAVLTCNDRWREERERASEVDLGPHLAVQQGRCKEREGTLFLFLLR